MARTHVQRRSRDEGLGLEEEGALHGACLGGFALEAFALGALVPEEAGVLDGDSDVSGEGLKDLKLVFGKGVYLGVFDAESADDLSGGFQGNAHGRARLGLAGDVIGVFRDIGRVAHFAGGGDVSDHALQANFEARALLVFGAATNTAQHQFVGFSIAKPDIDFDVSDGGSDVVDDAVENRIEIEGGGDEIRCPLELHEDVGEVTRGLNARRKGVSWPGLLPGLWPSDGFLVPIRDGPAYWMEGGEGGCSFLEPEAAGYRLLSVSQEAFCIRFTK